MRHLEQIGEGDNNHQCLGEDCSLALGLGRRGTLLIRWRLGVAEGRPGGSGQL